MSTLKNESYDEIVLEHLDKNPRFVMQAVKWLANYLITTKILTNDPEFLSTEAYRAELRRAETRQDPAYFALLWIQQLRSLTKE